MSVFESNLMTMEPEPTVEVAERGHPAGAGPNDRARDVVRGIHGRDICTLARQLATLLQAGMPLVPAISVLVEQLNGVPTNGSAWHPRRQNPLGLVLEDVRDGVNSGATLSSALAGHPGVFSNLFVSMVAAGEAGGTLEKALLRLAEMLENREQLAAKVKSVIAYPVMLAVVATGVVVFLISFVVPSITEIFIEMNRVLPWPTRMLISISAFMKAYFVLIPVIICAALVGLRAWLTGESGRLPWDRTKLKMPLFGGLLLKLEIARLARTLGVLLASGVPILGAIDIVKGVIQNRFVANAMDDVRNWVGRGDSVANAFGRTGLFPPIVVHIVATGQLSGNVEDSLANISDMYDREIETAAKTLTSLLEPAVLLVMGGIVGFIVLAVLLPIFEINQVF